MFYNSYANKQGLSGANPQGQSVNKWASINWKRLENLRGYGVDGRDVASFTTGIKGSDDQRAKALEKYSGYTFMPKRADGSSLDAGETVPIEWGGRTYVVEGGDDRAGLKIINEKLLNDIAEESIQRNEKINEITELLVYTSDEVYMIFGADFYDKAKAAKATPSQLSTVTTTADLADRILKLKQLVSKDIIDKVVIPTSTLQKIHRLRGKLPQNDVDMRNVGIGAGVAAGAAATPAPAATPTVQV